MPKFSIEHGHALGADEVKLRLQTLSERLASKYGINATWKTPTEATFKATGASGAIRCHNDKVVVDVDLGFALSMMKGQLETRIKSELEKALG
jgi:putative polyhydroxyalkanoate system protein